MAKFSIYLNTSVVSVPEPIKIGIDSTTVFEGDMGTTTINFELPLDSQSHTLWVELCDKKAENELRVNGVLIRDTYINIENISIDASMMNHLVHDCGYTTIDWDFHADVAKWFLENKNEVPKTLPKSNHLNLKGKYYFDFVLPIKDFLNRHITIDPSYTKFYNTSLDKYIELENKILSKTL